MNVGSGYKHHNHMSQHNLELVKEDYGSDVDMESVSDTSSNIDVSEIA